MSIASDFLLRIGENNVRAHLLSIRFIAIFSSIFARCDKYYAVLVPVPVGWYDTDSDRIRTDGSRVSRVVALTRDLKLLTMGSMARLYFLLYYSTTTTSNRE